MQQLTEYGDILIVDDEPSVVEVVALYLKKEGFGVRTAHDGNQALTELYKKKPALMVLDVMLPQVNGLEIMRQMQGNSDLEVPVIMLTARSQETDRIFGLELGADDYVTKPFSPAELVSRVKAVLRRTHKPSAETEPTSDALDFGEIQIDPQTRIVTIRGVETEVTATEFNLLWFMANNPRHVFNRDQLLENVWGFSEFVDPSTVTVHIRRLREKLEVDPSKPTWIATVWGVGYKFDPVQGATKK